MKRTVAYGGNVFEQPIVGYSGVTGKDEDWRRNVRSSKTTPSSRYNCPHAGALHSIKYSLCNHKICWNIIIFKQVFKLTSHSLCVIHYHRPKADIYWFIAFGKELFQILWRPIVFGGLVEVKPGYIYKSLVRGGRILSSGGNTNMVHPIFRFWYEGGAETVCPWDL